MRRYFGVDAGAMAEGTRNDNQILESEQTDELIRYCTAVEAVYSSSEGAQSEKDVAVVGCAAVRASRGDAGANVLSATSR